MRLRSQSMSCQRRLSASLLGGTTAFGDVIGSYLEFTSVSLLTNLVIAGYNFEAVIESEAGLASTDSISVATASQLTFSASAPPSDWVYNADEADPLRPMDTGSVLFNNNAGAFVHIADTSAPFGSPTFTTSMTVQEFVDAVDENIQIQAGDGASNFIDSTGWTATFVPVPEPCSFALLAMALLPTILWRRRLSIGRRTRGLWLR